ncbi:MAG: MlaA family lipoprotein, partial [Alphaproteobacteria bacterium]
LQIGGDTNFIDGSKRIFNTVFKVVDNREELLDIIDNIRQDSFDPYATIRSAYLQRRLAQIEN